ALTLTGSNAPYYTSSSVTFSTANGSDADSGLDLSSATVTRETGDLSGDSCNNFSADAGTFSSPDTTVSGGHCYRYSFTIGDNVGHSSTPPRPARRSSAASTAAAGAPAPARTPRARSARAATPSTSGQPTRPATPMPPPLRRHGRST